MWNEGDAPRLVFILDAWHPGRGCGLRFQKPGGVKTYKRRAPLSRVAGAAAAATAVAGVGSVVVDTSSKHQTPPQWQGLFIFLFRSNFDEVPLAASTYVSNSLEALCLTVDRCDMQETCDYFVLSNICKKVVTILCFFTFL